MTFRRFRLFFSIIVVLMALAIPSIAAPLVLGDIVSGLPAVGSVNPADNPNARYYRMVLAKDSWVKLESLYIDRPYKLGMNWKLADNDGVGTWASGIMYWQEADGDWSYGSTQGLGVDTKASPTGVFVLGKGEYFLKVDAIGIFNFMFMTTIGDLFQGTDKEPNDKRADAVAYSIGNISAGRLLGSNGAEYEKPGAVSDYIDYYKFEVTEAGMLDFKAVSDGFFTGDLTVTDSKGYSVAGINLQGKAHQSIKSNDGFDEVQLEEKSNAVSKKVEFKSPGTYYLEVRMSFPGTYKFSVMTEAQTAASLLDTPSAASEAPVLGRLIAESGNLKVYYSGTSVTVTGLDPASTYMLNLMPTDIASMMKAGSISANLGGLDDWEPNDSFEDANKDAFKTAFGSKNNTAAVKGRLSNSGDQDYFQFSVEEYGVVKVNLAAVGLDAEVELFDGNMVSIIKATKRAGRDSVSISNDLDPGKYYLLVSISKEPASKDYELEITWAK
ncbi:MAG TPA: PPC domain-containing protein [Bacillota bacterium]|nr:PPC domain-containing protein [Bacillota bacterium]